MSSSIASLARVVGRWRGQLLELVFPLRCAGCGQIGEPLCNLCISSIRYVSPPFCPRCSQRLRFEGEQCHHCRTFPLHLADIRAVAYHEGPLRHAIHALKYGRRPEVAAPLAALLQQHLLTRTLELDLITAVPLHPSRERERGYNQAELLARRAACLVGLPYVSGVTRIRATADQIGLDFRSRHENTRGAFCADAKAFRGARVLLIDDVCTTVATLDACAVALENQGARLIYGLVVARPR